MNEEQSQDNQFLQWDKETTDLSLETSHRFIDQENQRYRDLANKAYIFIVVSSILLPFSGIILQSEFSKKRVAVATVIILSSLFLLTAILLFIYSLKIRPYKEVKISDFLASENLFKPALEVKKRLLVSNRNMLDEYRKSLNRIALHIRIGVYLIEAATIAFLVAMLLILYSSFGQKEVTQMDEMKDGRKVDNAEAPKPKQPEPDPPPFKTEPTYKTDRVLGDNQKDGDPKQE